MSTTPRTSPASDQSHTFATGSNALLSISVCSAALLFLTAHIAIGLGAPLWLDEAWTGAFASVPTFSDLVHQAREEVGGPIYYILIWTWALVFGSSNISLHSFSLLLSASVPFIAWLGLRKSRPSIALVWAVLIAIWGPGIAQSGYARCYPLLSCLVTGTTIAYIHLLDRPNIKNAFWWTAFGTLTILTHYYAAILFLAQGIFLTAVLRNRAIQLWSSTVVVLPALVWVLLNLPRLTKMTSPALNWYHVLSFWDVPFIAFNLLGTQSLPIGIFLIAVIGCSSLFVYRHLALSNGCRQDIPVTAASAAALLSVVLFFLIGTWHPIFARRYLTIFEPGVALALAIWMITSSMYLRANVALSVMALVLVSCSFWFGPWPMGERIYSFEPASKWINERRPTRLVFFWDNPTSLTVPRDQLDLVGRFFFEREGNNIAVVSVYPTLGDDMNRKMSDEVGSDTAALWLYDLNVHDTSASAHKPSLSDRRPDLDCRDFGDASRGIGVLACRPRLMKL